MPVLNGELKTMKNVLWAMVFAGTLFAAPMARANVNNVEISVGRLDALEKCWAEVKLVAVEMNLFNGSETLRFNGSAVGTFAGLQGSYSNLSPGQTVLFGSPSFAWQASFTPDIEISDAACAGLAPGMTVDFLGSFGPVAGEFTLPPEFDLMTVAGHFGFTDLAVAAYILFGLEGELEVGLKEAAKKGGCGVGGGAGTLAGILIALSLVARRRRLEQA
jgi:hypothetical protein